MQQGLQERVENWNRIRKGQGSIYLQRTLCRQLERKLKQAETWLLKLGKFSRLIDYMICQNLVSILEDEISSFVANTLQVRSWVGWEGNQKPDHVGVGCALSSDPTTTPAPSFTGPKAKPLSLITAGL